MPVDLRVHFDNAQATFYAGQVVTGRVFVGIDKPKKIRGITIKFKGEAEVKWTESHNVRGSDGKHHTKYTHYSGHEMYCNNEYYLVGNGGEMELPAGQYNYPFQYQVPITAPSSFEGVHGHIRYTAKAVMDRPWKIDNECKVAFTVVCPLDLNTLPQVKQPIQYENSKHFCCLWCKSGPLTVTIRLPVSGYVPGQTIPFQIEIENASNVIVQPINCVLRKEVTWHARSPRHQTRVTKAVLADIAVDDAVHAHDTKCFSKDIVVPPVPPSNLSNCGIIDLEYALKVSVSPASAPAPEPAPGPHFGGGWNIPAPQEPGIPQPTDPSFAPSAPPQYPELPPPSYEECIFQGNNIKDASDNEYTTGQDFTPRYPVWAFSQPMGALGRLM
ncbi:hypothetical protein ONE63_002288 [Megalurothrips usitatus]|uniref:Arrestin C-terminal-like domain-containing protein n=1 Tax=Megalurothrips usitatus TaxID=439358 RepID=A0AAV7XB91_9NEOP|nr:hypothetical protein ONE63_002288 [Megalurothrips usitatus]